MPLGSDFFDDLARRRETHELHVHLGTSRHGQRQVRLARLHTAREADSRLHVTLLDEELFDTLSTIANVEEVIVVARLDADSLLVLAPADETFRWLLDAAHDVGEVTYVDRSMPIAEVLCTFEGEPATSLVLTLQGRGEGTEVFCTVESIEARPAPPVAAVVDLLELALHRRRDGAQPPGRTGSS